jgi:PAS domain S-box-containing protein
MGWVIAGLVILGLGAVGAQAMPAGPPGAIETGAPSFVVLGQEELGLSTAPSDLDLLADGRVVVTTQREIAFGDGVRWETFREVDGQMNDIAEVAVDDDGKIYTGIEGGVAQVVLGENGRWHANRVATFPVGTGGERSVDQFPGGWYWHGGTGAAIVSWRPGQAARIAGRAVTAAEVYQLGGDVYTSDPASGVLSHLKADGTPERVQQEEVSAADYVTCAVPFGTGQLLMGTTAAGLKIFDGWDIRPFGPPGLLHDGHRITDLCSTPEGFFAASIDTYGIVFFDHEGRTVQVLDRSLDHRLARINRLQYSRDGVLWALLNEGIARVEFPSPLSHFEALLAGGITYVQPLRHAGQVWVLADGRAMRGVYDAGGRLEGFADDTPAGRFMSALTDQGGRLFGSTDSGIYLYDKHEWRQIIPDLVDARIGVARSASEALYYVARGEFGTIDQTGQTYIARRTLVPALGENYNAEVDATGVGWFELGQGKVGRLDPRGGTPKFEIFGLDDGLPNGWAEIYPLDGIIRVHIGHHLVRFDETKRRFVEDLTLLAELPLLAAAQGRPGTDSSGRLWCTVNGKIEVIQRGPGGANRQVKIPLIGISPIAYTMQDDGVVWMYGRRRLARLDLRTPGPPPLPLRAILTSVEFSSSNRQLFAPDAALDPLEYGDNSLVFNFAAPANPFTSPITFEVLLEGGGGHWVSTGTVGSATYTRLKEGNYVFHVRPRAGIESPGSEARVQFTIRPPWFRTGIAWVAYFVLAGGSLALASRLSSYLQRREKSRLERLVAERTGELKATIEELGRQVVETTEKSAALSLSEERFRLLSAKLEDRVQKRTAELSHSNEELRQRELLFRLIFEHAPVGISWKRADLQDIYHVNPAFRQILDLPGGTMVDATQLLTLVHPEDAARQSEMNQLIAAGKSDSYMLEERFVLKDGRIVWGLLSVAVIRDETGRIVQEIGILADITARKRAENELAATHKRLLEISRQAGMAEIATGVLHNVGNVLNSVNVSATLVADNILHTKAVNIEKVALMLDQHKSNLAEFLTNDSRGRMIPSYLGALAESLATERATLVAELVHLRKNIEHIKDIVAMQQTYARTSGISESVSIPDLIEDAVRMNSASLSRHGVDMVRDYQVSPVITTEAQKVVQILVNLLGNAKHSCDDSGRADKKIIMRTTGGERGVKIAIVDNGIGIPAENLIRIFNHGFTTRKEGHGFGLHSGALAAKELGGSLTVKSDGRNLGATFTLELPFDRNSPTHENAAN